LPGGEIKTLITDRFELLEKCFPKLYFMRWPVETKYDVVKNKMTMETATYDD
jgi:hypothetical protein